MKISCSFVFYLYIQEKIAHVLVYYRKQKYHHESNWLKDCPKDFKPVYYKRYVDDIFVLFNKPEHAQFFLEYMNKKHKNMKLSIETEINRSLSFLDMKTFCENNKFVTSVFRKETFSGVYTNFISFVPLE